MITYLKRRKQRVKIGIIHSDWLIYLLGVPQGSLIYFFNIFVNDIIIYFTDDNDISISKMCCVVVAGMVAMDTVIQTGKEKMKTLTIGIRLK